MRLDGGVIDQDVNAPEILLHLIDNVLGPNLLGHILNICPGLASARVDLLHHMLDVDRRNIIRRNQGAALGKGLGQKPAGSLPGPGDQNNFAC